MAEDRRGRSPSVFLATTLLVALAVGAAASLLIGAALSNGKPPPVSTEFTASNEVVLYALIGVAAFFFSLYIVLSIVGRRRGSPGTQQGRAILNILLIFLVASLFVVAIRVYGGGGPLPTGAVPPGTNSTGNSTGLVPPPVGNVTNGTVGNFTPFLVPGVPGWVPYALVIGILVVVGVVVLPRVGGFLEDRRLARKAPRVVAPTADEVRQVLESAAGELTTGRDARAVIIRLYGELLSYLTPLVGSVDPSTPEEIRTLHLERLGIRPGAAVRLTRLFEEARYSSHPLSEETLEEAQDAIGTALSDLARAPGA